jgi:hypothetical protein
MGLALWQRSLAKASGLGLGGKLNPPTQFAAADKGRQNAKSEGLGRSDWAGRSYTANGVITQHRTVA